MAYARKLDTLTAAQIEADMAGIRAQATAVIEGCAWCGDTRQPASLTKDHLVPRWLLVAMPTQLRSQLNIWNRKVPACSTCNGRKGPIPPSIFARLPKATPGRAFPAKVSRGSVEWQIETREWSTIVTYVAQHAWHEMPMELIAYLIEVIQQEIVDNHEVVVVEHVECPPEERRREHQRELKRLRGDLWAQKQPAAPTVGDIWPKQY